MRAQWCCVLRAMRLALRPALRRLCVIALFDTEEIKTIVDTECYKYKPKNCFVDLIIPMF